MVPLRYEVRPKGRSVNLRLSEELLDAIKARAKEEGIPYQRFIRMTLEQALLRGRARARAS
jgi:predicted DNA binding CopG/RHH family protein